MIFYSYVHWHLLPKLFAKSIAPDSDAALPLSVFQIYLFIYIIWYGYLVLIPIQISPPKSLYSHQWLYGYLAIHANWNHPGKLATDAYFCRWHFPTKIYRRIAITVRCISFRNYVWECQFLYDAFPSETVSENANFYKIHIPSQTMSDNANFYRVHFPTKLCLLALEYQESWPGHLKAMITPLTQYWACFGDV